MAKNIMQLDAYLCALEGVSVKTNKPYFIPYIEVYTPYGRVELKLDTRTDKAGIVLDMLARKEAKIDG